MKYFAHAYKLSRDPIAGSEHKKNNGIMRITRGICQNMEYFNDSY